MSVVTRLAASLPATIATVAAVSLAAVAAAVKTGGLTIAGAIALYFVVWWTLLFAILPFGVRSQVETGPVEVGDPGAPADPQLREKAIWTTLVCAAVFLAVVHALPLAGL